MSTSLQIEKTPLPGVFLITPPRFGDHRGFFSECYNGAALAEHGVSVEFVQDNQSLSAHKGTVRGLHFQGPPKAQAKLVRCGRGRLFDVAVDIRRASPTYGHWVGYELSCENGRQLLVPAGFAHGFMTLEDDTEILYKVSDGYARESEGALLWSDPDIGINWPLRGIAPSLSDKDAAAPGISGFESPFAYQTPTA